MLVLLRVAFWAALLFSFVMAVLPHPPDLPGDPSDKILHVLAFSVLAALAPLAYPAARPARIGLLLSAFGALIEIVQTIPSLHRDAELIDWVADTAALAAVLSLATLLRAQLTRRAAAQAKSRADSASQA
jgi:VanZ family protein